MAGGDAHCTVVLETGNAPVVKLLILHLPRFDYAGSRRLVATSKPSAQLETRSLLVQRAPDQHCSHAFTLPPSVAIVRTISTHHLRRWQQFSLSSMALASNLYVARWKRYAQEQSRVWSRLT